MNIPSTYELICPYCSSKDIVGNGIIKGQIFIDVPLHNRPNPVVMDRQRYRCKSCGKTFLEKFEGIDERRSISLRLVDFIEQQSINRSFLSVSREVGLSEGTIRRIFSEFVVRLEVDFHPKTPDVLSFDLITIIGKTRYLPTNFKTDGIIGFLDDTSKTAINSYLLQLEEKWRIKKVVMDMNPDCREIVKYYLPDAKIVINPGHIMNETLQILENIRKDTRKGLSAKDLRLLTNDKVIIQKCLDDLTWKEKESFDVWEKRFKKLAMAYWHKEELGKLFQEDDKKKMLVGFDKWQKDVLADNINEYMPVIEGIFEWQEEVLNWFESKHSGKNKHYGLVVALEDAINRRLERGYSYEAIKARILSVKRIPPEAGAYLGAVTWSIVKNNPIRKFI